MNDHRVMMITGSSRGIGKFLAKYYVNKEFYVIGCSRKPLELPSKFYKHFCLDVSDEVGVKQIFLEVRQKHGRLDILINNAGIASMNHSILTPLTTVHKILNTNVVGTFLFCRESAKLMQKNQFGRIINFATIATPLKIEGESIYAASKAAVVALTQILAREFAEFGITVNAVGPTPIRTDLIHSVEKSKIDSLINLQAIRRFGEFRDIANVIDFFIKPESDFITGQIIYLGGI